MKFNQELLSMKAELDELSNYKILYEIHVFKERGQNPSPLFGSRLEILERNVSENRILILKIPPHII